MENSPREHCGVEETCIPLFTNASDLGGSLREQLGLNEVCAPKSAKNPPPTYRAKTQNGLSTHCKNHPSANFGQAHRASEDAAIVDPPPNNYPIHTPGPYSFTAVPLDKLRSASGRFPHRYLERIHETAGHLSGSQMRKQLAHLWGLPDGTWGPLIKFVLIAARVKLFRRHEVLRFPAPGPPNISISASSWIFFP